MSKITVLSTDGIGKPKTIEVETGSPWKDVLEQLGELQGVRITITNAGQAPISGDPSTFNNQTVQGDATVVKTPANQRGN